MISPKDKLILITGGSSGIGKAAAKELHSQGARIILQARNPEKLKAAAAEISPNGERLSYYATNLSDQEAVAATAAEIIAREGLPEVMAYFLSLGPDLSHVNGYGGNLVTTIIHGSENAPGPRHPQRAAAQAGPAGERTRAP